MTRALLLALALAALAFPAVAGAHATVQRTVPERGAALQQAPPEVRFEFNEPVEAAFGAVRVFDAKGNEVHDGAAFHPGGRSKAIAVKLRRGLGEGGYTATFRVISADGHPVSGGIVFGVGEGAGGGKTVAELLAGQGSGPATSVAFGFARGTQFAAIAIGLGALIFLLACWLPALREAAGAGADWTAAADAFAGRARATIAAAAAAGVLSGAFALACQGATATGDTVWSAFAPDVIREVLETRFGVAWGAATVLWLVAGGLALTRLARVPLALAMAPLALLPSLGGHASTQAPVWLNLPANAIHVLAMSAWVGGIAAILVSVRAATARLEPSDRTRLLAGSVARFSTMAGLAVAALLTTGVIQSIISVRTFPALLDSAYGRAVLIKAILFAALMGLGWINRRRLVPALRSAAAATAAPGRAGVLLRRTLRAEAALMLAVLGVTAALASYAPSVAETAGPFSTDTDIGPARLEVTVEPATVGANEMHLYLFDRRTGAQYDATKEITIAASLPGKDVAPIELDATKAGPGHYVVSGGSFSLAGDWRVTVDARVSEFDQYRARFDVPIE